jgi:hypothetical protein
MKCKCASWRALTFHVIIFMQIKLAWLWPDDGSKHVAFSTSIKYIYLSVVFDGTLFTHSFIYSYTTGWLHSKTNKVPHLLPHLPYHYHNYCSSGLESAKGPAVGHRNLCTNEPSAPKRHALRAVKEQRPVTSIRSSFRQTIGLAFECPLAKST